MGPFASPSHSHSVDDYDAAFEVNLSRVESTFKLMETIMIILVQRFFW